MATAMIKQLCACSLAGILLLGIPTVSSLANVHPSRTVRRGDLTGSASDHSRSNRWTSPAKKPAGQYSDFNRKRLCNSLISSMATSHAETVELSPSTDGSKSSTSSIDLNASSRPTTDTGSTAIILNMNARSVTPQLISIASNIVGENNVFVTKTAEDATLAARTVVTGCPYPYHDTATATTDGDELSKDDSQHKYSLVLPVGGDGTLSGWINTLVDEVLLFHKPENETAATMSVEEAMKELPLVGYIPMGTGNGLGYVIGCKSGSKSRKKSDRFREVTRRLKDVGDAVQETEQMHQQQERVDISSAVAGKCSIVEMPLMEVSHPDEFGIAEDKGDLCFFGGAGFDSLMLHDFQQIKAWSKSPRRTLTPLFVKDALSSVTGYCVALVTKTLPQALKYGTHKIHVEVTTRDENTLWVDHRRGDFSELAIRPAGQSTNNSTAAATTTSSSRHLIYSGTTGIIAASTTPYYGGGMRLFPYARLVPDKLQLRLGRISPLTGFFNIPKIFEGSYREKSERSFGCLDFIGNDFEVEVRSGRYDEYVERQRTEKKKRGGKWFQWLRRSNRSGDNNNAVGKEDEGGKQIMAVAKGFPFQHSGESMGCKERFRLRVVQEPVKFISFLGPRVVVDE